METARLPHYYYFHLLLLLVLLLLLLLLLFFCNIHYYCYYKYYCIIISCPLLGAADYVVGSVCVGVSVHVSVCNQIL